jgi:3-hydroxyisobutyrate dehydrogenase-like beta-hydroxyacid dehydrogenase
MACEAITFGTNAGIRAEKILEVVNAGTGQSDASLVKVAQHVLTRTFDYGGSLRISLKDLAQYHEETVRAGVANGIATAVKDAYLAAGAHGHLEADMTAIALYMEEISGKNSGPR